jgi:acetyl-CoA acyltransferase 2
MASLTKGIFIIAAKRTPIGTFGGKLSSKTSTDLQEIAFRAALGSGNVDPKLIDSVVVGNVQSGTSKDGSMISRHAGLRVGVPIERPALTVNRLCGSGFQSIVTGVHDILMGDSAVVLTGGSESMSQAPFVVRNVRFGTRLGTDYQFEDSLWTGLADHGCSTSMGQTAENLAEKYGISREDADQFSLESQQRWKSANDSGRFTEEMAPVKLKIKGQEVEMTVDEHPRQTTREALAKLPSIFKKNGTVTAGTASGISDGASSLILASEAACCEYNFKPLARLVGYGIAGVEPTIMGIGPVPAIQKLMKVTGKSLGNVDLVEINEAFASQTIACERELGLDHSKVNVNGGAVALGHPVGASGSRIAVHLVYELRRRKAKYGIGSACIGGGQGIALLIESIPS